MCKDCKILLKYIKYEQEKKKKMTERRLQWRAANVSTIKDMIANGNYYF